MDDSLVKIGTGVVVAAVSATAYLVGRITTGSANHKALAKQVEDLEARVSAAEGEVKTLMLAREREAGAREALDRVATGNTGPHPVIKR